MKKVVVTGGSGKLGIWVLKEFVEQGYQVVNVDTRQPAEQVCKTVIANLTNLGEAYGVLADADAVVHLAAIPVAYSFPNEVVFQNNTVSTYNILEAAAGLGIKKAVIASSESSYGIVFSRKNLKPMYVPMDEEHPQLPEDSYGLSKIVGEQTAEMFNRRTGMQVVCMRIGNVNWPERYPNFPNFYHDSKKRKELLWSYVDARDVASACRLAIEADGLGAVALNLSADDTSMDIKSRELLAQQYPEITDIREPLDGYETLLCNKKAKELLKWQPKYSWRSYAK